MEYRDYVILIDENGCPYIAHGVWDSFKSAGKKFVSGVKTAGSAAHKYLLKVGEGAQAQYAYTQQEVDRLLGRGKQKLSDTAEAVKNNIANATGYAAEQRVKDAQKKYEEATKAQEAALNNYYKNDKVIKQTKNSRDSSAYAQSAYDKAVSGQRDYYKDLDKRIADRNEALEALSEAKKDYSKTPLAKVKEFAKDPIGKIDDATWSARYDAKEAVKNVGNAIADKAKKVSGADAKTKMNQAEADFIRSSLDAGRAQQRAAAANVNLKDAERYEEESRIRYRAAEDAVEAAQDAVIKAQADYRTQQNTRDMYKKQFDEMGDDFKEKLALALSSNAKKRREEVYKLFVDANIKAADAKVAAEQAMRAYDSAIKKRATENINLGNATVKAVNAKDYAISAERKAADAEGWAKFDKDRYEIAKNSYADTPLAKIESFANNAKDKASNVVDKGKEKLLDLADKAVSKLPTTVTISYPLDENMPSHTYTTHDIKNAEKKVSSLEKTAEKYKRPGDNIFTLDKGTGETAKASEMYDKYMGEANELLGQLKANAARGVAPTKEQIAEVENLYELAVGSEKAKKKNNNV